jgi:E3 ubiquitin-protein ligase mind-bomb
LTYTNLGSQPHVHYTQSKCAYSFIYSFRPQNAPSVYVPVTQKKDKCKLCDDETATITFNPCQHKIVCLDCSIRLKRCIECNQVIKEKITNSGSSLSVNKSDFAQLLNKIQALEEAQQCSICMERKKDTAFQCGHIACGICALPLKACHICREKVVKRFKIYET